MSQSVLLKTQSRKRKHPPIWAMFWNRPMSVSKNQTLSANDSYTTDRQNYGIINSTIQRVSLFRSLQCFWMIFHRWSNTCKHSRNTFTNWNWCIFKLEDTGDLKSHIRCKFPRDTYGTLNLAPCNQFDNIFWASEWWLVRDQSMQLLKRNEAEMDDSEVLNDDILRQRIYLFETISWLLLRGQLCIRPVTWLCCTISRTTEWEFSEIPMCAKPCSLYVRSFNQALGKHAWVVFWP